jgi:hypothetical protein
MNKAGIDVVITGPLIKRGIPLSKDAAEDAVQELVELGEQALDKMLRPRPQGVYLSAAQGGTSTGNYRRNVNGMVQGMKGRIEDGGVIYGPWLEFGGGRFKGYAAFRKVGQDLEKKSEEVLEKHMAKAIRKMRGS